MKKGFTLIELIMVITLLGIIALIAVPAVNKSIQNSREKAYNEQERLVINGAKQYVAKHDLANNICVTVATLQEEGFLSNNIQNPAYRHNNLNVVEKDKEFNGAIQIETSCVNCDNINEIPRYKYSYEYKNNSNCLED